MGYFNPPPGGCANCRTGAATHEVALGGSDWKVCVRCHDAIGREPASAARTFASRIELGERVRVRQNGGADAGKTGVVVSVTLLGTHRVRLDGEPELKYPDGAPWYPQYDGSSLERIVA